MSDEQAPLPGSEAYSWCESSQASSISPWHIRKLDEAGRKTGGGITTSSLCGRVRPFKLGSSEHGWGGWDLDEKVKISPAHGEHACPACWKKLLAELAPR